MVTSRSPASHQSVVGASPTCRHSTTGAAGAAGGGTAPCHLRSRPGVAAADRAASGYRTPNRARRVERASLCDRAATCWPRRREGAALGHWCANAAGTAAATRGGVRDSAPSPTDGGGVVALVGGRVVEWSRRPSKVHRVRPVVHAARRRGSTGVWRRGSITACDQQKRQARDWVGPQLLKAARGWRAHERE